MVASWACEATAVVLSAVIPICPRIPQCCRVPYHAYQYAGWVVLQHPGVEKIADIWEKYGSGLTNFHGATGDIILLGTKTDKLQDASTL